MFKCKNCTNLTDDGEIYCKLCSVQKMIPIDTFTKHTYYVEKINLET